MDNSIGIYIHIPFCKSKCNYCDFNSYSGREHLAGPYFNALFSEMRMRAEKIRHRRVKTIFIGGGTPSLVDPKYIRETLELCSKLFDLEPDAEISMESNPGTLTFERLKEYGAAGVNRLSIGLQAWQDRLLKELGRIHDRRQFVENYETAVKAGFRNINIDLIFGLPGQTMEEWVETLEAVTSLGTTVGFGSNTKNTEGQFTCVPEQAKNTDELSLCVPSLTHLSCYSLKIEEGTNFGDRYEKGTLSPANDDLDRRMYKYTIEYLAQKGYKQYEISNFAQPGYECRHNLIYWKALEYAGFGAGAHSYLDDHRFENADGIEKYIELVKQEVAADQTAIHARKSNEQYNRLHEEVQFISQQESMSEYMILGLRLIDGVNAKKFEIRYGKSLKEVYGDKLDKLVKKGLLVQTWTGNEEVCSDIANKFECCSYKLTLLGLDLANQVFVEFI